MDYFEKIIYLFTQEIENLSCQLEEIKGPFPMMDPRRIKELEDALTKVEHDKTNLIRVKQSYLSLCSIITNFCLIH